MTFPVLVEPRNGQFAATLVGIPHLEAVAPTRDQAMAQLRTALEQRIARGEIVPLEVPPVGVSHLAGRFADDPDLREICAEAYRNRDAEPME